MPELNYYVKSPKRQLGPSVYYINAQFLKFLVPETSFHRNKILFKATETL